MKLGNSIKLSQARGLILNNRDLNMSDDDLVLVDRVARGKNVECIFKKEHDDQLYSFWYYDSDDPYIGITVDTIQKFDSFINDDDNLDVEITPVRKITKKIEITEYAEDD